MKRKINAASKNLAVRLSPGAFFSLFPALFVVTILFGGGFVLVIAESVGFLAGVRSELTLSNFERIWNDREIRAAFSFTVYVTTASTLLAAIIGTSAAVWLRTEFEKSAFLKTLLQFPIAVPHLAIALLLLNFFAPSGFFARVGFAAGWIENPQQFPVLINDGWGVGIILGYVLKESPFVALFVLTILARGENDFEQVAQNLGASRRQRFRFVTLPLVAPAVVFSSLIVWAFVFGAFEMPLLLGRSFPSMLAINAQRKFAGTDLTDRPEAMALAFLMTAVSIVFVWLYLRLAQSLDTESSAFF